MKQLSLLLTVIIFSISAYGQKKIKVLFIGDSYTSVNNLPLTIANVAKANGDTLIYDSNTPGGTTLQGQTTNATTLSKIAQGGWDYVVLQAQSEEPSFPPAQVQTDTYPYAAILDSLIHAADSCTETVFYMTWGHQNGDPPNCAAYPQICTYTGMQDRLTQSYLEMGQLNHATVAPVGEAWRKVVSQAHSYDMYLSDSTHPSVYGTYLAANVFYEILFQKEVTTDTFVTAGIADSTAIQLRQIAHSAVSDSLSKWLSSGNIPVAAFTYRDSNEFIHSINFSSTSINGESFIWDFGDGTFANGTNAYHIFSSTDSLYTVTLTVDDHCKESIYSQTISIYNIVSIGSLENDNTIKVYPNPTSSLLYIDLGDLDLSNVTIVLTNGLGQPMIKTTTHSSLMTISVADLSPGLYVLSVSGLAFPVLIK